MKVFPYNTVDLIDIVMFFPFASESVSLAAFSPLFFLLVSLTNCFIFLKKQLLDILTLGIVSISLMFAFIIVFPVDWV